MHSRSAFAADTGAGNGNRIGSKRCFLGQHQRTSDTDPNLDQVLARDCRIAEFSVPLSRTHAWVQVTEILFLAWRARKRSPLRSHLCRDERQTQSLDS